MYTNLALIALELAFAPKITVDLAHPGAPVPALLFGTNLPARAETTARIPALLKSFGVSMYRYPGGSSPGWHWMTGAMDFPVSEGEGSCALNRPAEIVGFVAAAGGELLITPNVESGTASEAAGLAAELRARGTPVTWWEIGNEVFGDWDKGYRSATQYVADLQSYAGALRAASPGAKIGADMAGAFRDRDTDGDAVDTADWDRVVLRGAGGVIDFMSYHWYPGRRAQEEPMHVMAGSLRIPLDVARFRQLAAELSPARKLELAYLEWDGVFDNDTTGARGTLANAIFYADALGQMMNAGVEMAAHYDATTRSYGLIAGYAPCVVRPGGFAAWDGVTVRPKAYALALAAKLAGGALLPVVVTGGTSYAMTTTFPLQEFTGMVPHLAAYGVRTQTGLKLLVVHRQATAAAEVEVMLEGGAGGEVEAQVSILTGPSLTASNDGNPGQVAVTTELRQLAVPGFTLTVPPRSVMLIELPLAGATPADGGVDGGGDSGDSGGGCGCRTGCSRGGRAGGATAAGLGLLAVGLALMWVRRRR